MIVTDGGRFGGYGLYLLKGKPVFTYNFLDMERTRWEGPEALAAGKHTLVFDFKDDGPGFGKGGTGVLSVDGKEVANKKMPHTIPFLLSFDETFDVGVDTRTGVDDNDYQVPFRFTGKVDKLTVKLEEPKRTAAEEDVHQKKNTGSQESRPVIVSFGRCWVEVKPPCWKRAGCMAGGVGGPRLHWRSGLISVITALTNEKHCQGGLVMTPDPVSKDAGLCSLHRDKPNTDARC